VTSTEELFAAIEAGNVEAVCGIVTGDASLAAARDAEGVSALMRAQYRLDRELVQAVMAGEPALDVFEAAAFGDQVRLMDLVDRDPSLATAFSADGFSALHLAAFFGQVETARLLLDRGSDPNARGCGWMTGTALHSASSGSHVAIGRLLLEAGADPNARQSGGWTPLHSAAHNGNSELVGLLLGHGADPTAVNEEGATVLALAEEEGDADSVARIRQALG